MSKHTDQKPPRIWRRREEIVGYESQLIAASKRPTESVEISYPTAKALIEICQQARHIERLREQHPTSVGLQKLQDHRLSMLVKDYGEAAE